MCMYTGRVCVIMVCDVYVHRKGVCYDGCDVYIHRKGVCYDGL